MGIRFDSFCDMVSEITEQTAKLASGLAETGREAIEEIVEDPVKYTVDSAREVTQIAKGMVGADCCDLTVKPVVGSVLFCNMYCGLAEHSGIYVGNNRIVHLNSNGLIESVSPAGFIVAKDGGLTSRNIYVSSRSGNAVGSRNAAKRAKEMLGGIRNYNPVLNNCHQFVSGCLTGDFENADNFMWMLKDTCLKKLNADTWSLYHLE
jgi:hypothetical protein